MSTWRTAPDPIAEDKIKFRHSCDVVVVGLGHAGSAAVRAAAESGVKVIGIEQMKDSRYSTWGADVGHINSKFLESRGVPKVDPLDYFNEMMRRALNRANPGLIMKFAQNSGTTFDWYTDMFEDMSSVSTPFWPGGSKFDGEMSGYKFWPGTAKFRAGGHPGGGMPPRPPEDGGSPEGMPQGMPGGAPGEFPGGGPGGGGMPGGPDDIPHGAPGAMHGGGPDMMSSDSKTPSLLALAKANQQKAVDLGGEMYFGVEGIQLVKAGDRVIGVIGKDSDGEYHLFSAKNGVVLSAGDFGGNKEMLDELVIDIKGLFTEGQKFQSMGRSGRGIQMGVWAGGRIEAGPIPAMGGNFNTPRGFNCVHGILWLGPDGKRFCNEVFGDPVITGQAGNQTRRGDIYNIFDSAIMDDLQWAVPAHEGFDMSDAQYVQQIKTAMEGAKKAGVGGCVHRAPNGPVRIVAGNTMDELLDNAELTGEVRENVKKSIERYNELCRKGRDDDFGKDAKLLRPLEQWPLFLQFNDFNYVGRIMCTVGGLVTDENQNVLDLNFNKLPGLYATGNCCGRRFGPQYSTPTAGISIGIAIVLGREAGIAAATLA